MATSTEFELKPQNRDRTVVELYDWLLESGIQAPGGHFYAWYDLERGVYVRPYPEITGYGISTLCWLFDLIGEPGLLNRAQRALSFLAEDAIHPDWNLVGTQRLSSLGGTDAPVFLHAFDSGIVATALERLAQLTSDRQASQLVDRMVDTFRTHLLLDDGSVWPLIDLRSGGPASRTQKWSEGFSGYQLKSLMFLMLRLVNREGSQEVSTVRRAVDMVLGGQERSGAFPSYPNGETHLHPHLYTLEAICVAAAVCGDDEWLARVADGYRYLERLIEEHGCVPTRAYWQKITVPFERADIVAQFLRLGSYLCSVGCIGRRHLDEVLSWARRRLQQYVIEEGRHRGGVLFGQDWDGAVKHHVNCAVTLISAQAIHWYESAQNRVPVDPLELV